jgi:hypothetical protein
MAPDGTEAAVRGEIAPALLIPYVGETLGRREHMHKAQMNRRLVLMATTGTMSAALARGAGAATEAIWSGEYWATKQRNGSEIRLAMYRKRPGAPQPGEAALPVLFLVHGSSNSARSSFDLTVPGGGEYSTMNVFARYGFDVWTRSTTKAMAGPRAPTEIRTSPVAWRICELQWMSSPMKPARRVAIFSANHPERCARLRSR